MLNGSRRDLCRRLRTTKRGEVKGQRFVASCRGLGDPEFGSFGRAELEQYRADAAKRPRVRVTGRGLDCAPAAGGELSSGEPAEANCSIDARIPADELAAREHFVAWKGGARRPGTGYVSAIASRARDRVCRLLAVGLLRGHLGRLAERRTRGRALSGGLRRRSVSVSICERSRVSPGVESRLSHGLAAGTTPACGHPFQIPTATARIPTSRTATSWRTYGVGRPSLLREPL